jgi:hypothetical protein
MLIGDDVCLAAKSISPNFAARDVVAPEQIFATEHLDHIPFISNHKRASWPGLSRPSILFAKRSYEERWTTRNRVYPISGILSAQVG